MKKSVFLEAYIYEAGIESGHQFSDFAHVHVPYSERKVPFLFLKFHEILVFQQGDGDFFGLYIYY